MVLSMGESHPLDARKRTHFLSRKEQGEILVKWSVCQTYMEGRVNVNLMWFTPESFNTLCSLQMAWNSIITFHTKEEDKPLMAKAKGQRITENFSIIFWFSEYQTGKVKFWWNVATELDDHYVCKYQNSWITHGKYAKINLKTCE